jgi:hypothetical protein
MKLFGKQLSGIFLVWLMVSSAGYSQGKPALDDFSAVLLKDQVYLSWVITVGSTCDGTKIYRSADTLNFDQIGDIQGICGSTSAPQSYFFYDTIPLKNATNYYRLELGALGYSQIVSVDYISLNNNNFDIRPHPAFHETKIYFHNPQNDFSQLSIFTLEGKTVANLSTKEPHFTLNVSNFMPGMYVFAIISPSGKLKTKGKLIIQH